MRTTNGAMLTHICEKLPPGRRAPQTNKQPSKWQQNSSLHPHTFLAADSPWDPSVLDKKIEEEFCDAVTELPEAKE